MFNDRFSRTEKPFHSSGYAEVAQGVSMGSTNAQSFNERYRLERNRQHVQRYGNSHLANAPLRRSNEMSVNRQGEPLSPRPITIPPRSHFSEPSGRNYNPFG